MISSDSRRFSPQTESEWEKDKTMAKLGHTHREVLDEVVYIWGETEAHFVALKAGPLRHTKAA